LRMLGHVPASADLPDDVAALKDLVLTHAARERHLEQELALLREWLNHSGDTRGSGAFICGRGAHTVRRDRHRSKRSFQFWPRYQEGRRATVIRPVIP